MKLVLLLGLLAAAVYASSPLDNLLDIVPKTTQELVDLINNDDKIPFMAQHYDRFSNKPIEQLKNYLGLATDPEIERAKAKAASRRRVPRQSGWWTTSAPSNLPTNFTVSDKWSNCASVFNIIQDQSACGDCWAVSAASVMDDRRCIVKGTGYAKISSWDMTSCCTACQGTKGNGCKGGYPTEAFKFFDTTGVVSGGLYGTTTSCKPYPVQPNISNGPTSTACSLSCQSKYTSATYSADKRKGGTYQVFSQQNDEVMQEIYNNGPVVATFTVYQDFMNYKSGVYQYTTGNYVGGHAVRIVGWGEAMDGTPYWRIANSWGSAWGDKGFVNFIRGDNDCGIDGGIISGTVI